MISCRLGLECPTLEGDICEVPMCAWGHICTGRASLEDPPLSNKPKRGEEVSEVNKQQVGGTHYKTSYEHWDLVFKTNMGYFEGQATKYIMRWRKKNGLQDLQKGVHFVSKLIELVPNLLELEECTLEEQAELEREIKTCAAANELTDEEIEFVTKMIFWRCEGTDTLHQARDIVLRMMEQADASNPVPVEDSNRHADRYNYEMEREHGPDLTRER